MRNTKIATCCYCGTRAALVLRGSDRHELACASCGAPLHDLKMLPKEDRGKPRELVRPSRVRASAPMQEPKGDWGRRRKKKRKKSLGRRFLSEAWDVIEDIFD